MSKQTAIKENELITIEDAAELLNTSLTTVRKYIKSKLIRRVKDKTKLTVSYAFKPDVEQLIENRFYFEGEENE